MVLLFGLVNLTVSAQTNASLQEDPNARIYMSHFRNNWDDIHDVIMRFHNDDPTLNGTVFINMNWQKGILVSASVDSNTTGNSAFGLALIAAMKKWNIPGMTESWITTVPIRTLIYGSDNPQFNECGIFTGNVIDINGKPLSGVKLILYPKDNTGPKSETNSTNREGVFIWTLIPVGDWRLECTKDGYLPTIVDKLTFEKGKHLKKVIILKNRL